MEVSYGQRGLVFVIYDKRKIFFCKLQGTPIKDVVISENAPKTLMLQKHADYIAAYSSKKEDYVRHIP